MHGDLKLENVLVNYYDSDDDDMIIKDLCIADFGMAVNLKKKNIKKQLRGSLPYIAPELFLDR